MAPEPSVASPRRAGPRDALRAFRHVTWRVGYRRSRWPRPLGTRSPRYLAVCAIFRDESPQLAEWVTFHRLQGVERFWLYDNRSADDWRSALAPELRSGLVEVTPWPLEPGQLAAYADCLSRHRDDARWIAFIDLDEFLFSPSGCSLPEVLRRFDSHPAVVVNWRTYGTSGYLERPDGLVVERFVWRMRADRPLNEHVKSIVYPRRTSTWVQNPHMFRLYGSAVGEDGRPVNTAFRVPPTTDLLRINHYWSRSVADGRVKLANPRADTGAIDRRDILRRHLSDGIEERDDGLLPGDEIRDDTMSRFLPALKTELARRGS